MSSLPIWVQYLQAMLVPVLTIFAAIIAYRQWRTARNALRLNLFDGRFQVYVDVLDFIGKVLRRGYPEPEDLPGFMRARDRAQFLFGQEVIALLNEINAEATALHTAHSQLGTEEGNARLKAVSDKYALLTKKFTAYDARLIQAMSPYLGFSMVKERR